MGEMGGWMGLGGSGPSLTLRAGMRRQSGSGAARTLRAGMRWAVIVAVLFAAKSVFGAVEEPKKKPVKNAASEKDTAEKDTVKKGSAKKGAKPKKAPAAVVAASITLSDKPLPEITVDQVEALVGIAQAREKTDEETAPRLRAEALQALVDRRLIGHFLTERKLMATPDETVELLARFKTDVERKGLVFADFLTERKLTEASVTDQLVWDYSWNNYLREALTDEACKAYFEAHRREFDGGKTKVSHILLRVEKGAIGEPGADPTNTTIEKAKEIREQIVGGKLTFAEAAKKHSTGPSRKQGGSLGWIPRHGEMAEEFAQAAFALKTGEISEPVVSPFGVHLIQCDEIRPGERTVEDAMAEITPPLGKELLSKILAEIRPQAKITYTGATPYFQAETNELVVP